MLVLNGRFPGCNMILLHMVAFSIAGDKIELKLENQKKISCYCTIFSIRGDLSERGTLGELETGEASHSDRFSSQNLVSYDYSHFYHW